MIIALKGEGANWFKLQKIMNVAAEKKHTPQSIHVCINLFNNYCKQNLAYNKVNIVKLIVHCSRNLHKN